jgi:hypothetical protein
MINIAERQVAAALNGQMSHSDEMALMKFIADRTGFTPGSHVEVAVKPWESALRASFKKALDAGTEAPGIVREPSPEELTHLGVSTGTVAFAQPSWQEVIDAELVEDEPEPDVIHLTSERAARRPTPRVGSADPPRRDR